MTKNYWKMQELLQSSINITKHGNLLLRKKSGKNAKINANQHKREFILLKM